MEASCARFTAAEGGARLAMAASDKNILAVEYSSFIATRLIHEDAYKIRGSLFDGSQRSIYVTRASRVACVSYELNIMTDLKLVGAVNVDDVYDWCAEVEKKEVLVCTSSVLKHILEEGTLSMENINILIIDSCHLIWRDENLQYVMKIYKESDKDKRPRILALTYPLFTSNKNEVDKNEKAADEAKDNKEIKNTKDENEITETEITETKDTKTEITETKVAETEVTETKDTKTEVTETKDTKTEITETKVTETEITIKDEAMKSEVDLDENLDDYEMYEKLEWKIEELEKELCCEMDLAEDIDSGKRLSYTLAKPKELVVEYSEALPQDVLPDHYKELEMFMRNTVNDALDFIDEHRYDPTEIYGEDLYEEFKNIPDPTIEPKDIFKQFLYVLDQLGPYAADKAAFTLLSKLEKLKIKVPYERHFILLCLCTTVFVKIRCYADLMFSKYESDWDKIKIFSTPKVLRFAEILIKFQPPDLLKTAGENTTKMLSDLEKCDFVTLGNKIEDKVNTFVANLKDLDDYSEFNLEKSNLNETSETKTKSDIIINENGTETKLNSESDLNNANTLTNLETKLLINNVNNLVPNQFETNNIQSEIACSKDNIVVNDKTYSSETKIDTGVPKEGEIYTIDNIINSETKTDVKNVPIEGEICIKDNIISDKINSRTKIDISIPLKGEICTRDNIVGDKIDSETKIDIKSVPKEGEICVKDNIVGDKIDSETKIDIKSVPIEGEICTKDNIVGDKIDSGTKIDIKSVSIEGETCTGDKIDKGTKDIKSVLLDNSVFIKSDTVKSVSEKEIVAVRGRRVGGRARGRGRAARGGVNRMQLLQQNPDALCGIVFMKEALMAKIMFMLIVDMCRAQPLLSYLCAQYCALDAAPERDTQRHGKKHEEVLKKFRMHECNLLLATSALEEGIDLPRCNLVLRWDLPPSYRSYGLSRGRARASRASCVVLCCSAGGTRAQLVQQLCTYRQLDQIISRKCGCGIQNEPPESEENAADTYTLVIKPYTPLLTDKNASNYNPKRNTHKVDNNKKDSNDKVENCLESDVTENIKPYLLTDKDTSNSNPKTDTYKVDNTKKGSNDKVENCLESDVTDNIKPYTPLVTDKNTSNYNPKTNTHKVDNTNNVLSDKVESCLDSDVTENIKPYTPLLTDKDTSNSNPKTNTYKVDNTKKDSNNKVENCLESDVTENIKPYTPLLTDKDTSNSNPNTNSHKVDNTNNVLSDKVENCLEPNVIEKPNLKLNKNINELEKDTDCTEFNGKCDNDISLGSDKSVNIVCNKCNKMKDSDCVECSCLVQSVSLGVSRTGSKVERDKKSGDCDIASVDLSTAIALINRYCGKLPSDTFTRLAPQWWMEEVQLPTPGSGGTKTAYVCTLRLPLNCPVKYNIVGHPMPSVVLARRMAALQACRILHKSGELDNQLMPIGKENFKAAELDTNLGCNNDTNDASDAARPGTTKRRQYYFKKTAWAFTDCQPVIDCTDAEIDSPSDAPKEGNTEPGIKGTKRNMLYAIVSKLWCALPERYNTRGRRLHAPQHASQAIGILMAKEHNADLQIPAFPVYTRSGEVRVCVERVLDADARLSPRRARLVRRFMRFVFAEVLRVRRRGMRLCSEGSTHNNYYIVPTVRSILEDGTIKTDIDWSFLELIYQHTEEKKHSELEKPVLWNQDEDEFEEPDEKVEKKKEKDGRVKEMENPILKPGEVFFFDAEKYKEAVVTPWYRNQDQPQFFLVAEICWNLTPDSAFPSAAHSSFRAYYLHKYGAKLTQAQQPLLDVDHTSARLNLLTPRYVNRKGVALPVSSERTRRAKRDRLDQKQILVPELCKVHPFAAPLWFATVALPCVLYRINALLIADEIRRAVAIEVGLGVANIQETCPGFQWPPLDFGWSLAEVLSADSEKGEKKKDEDDTQGDKEIEDEEQIETEDIEKKPEEPPREKTINDILQEKVDAESGFEIGTWSNEMASSIPEADEYDELMEPLPSNLTFCTSASGGANWCEPIEKPKSQFNPSRTFSMAESDCSYMSSDFDTDDSDMNSDSDEDTESSGFWSKGSLGVRIEYKTAHEAEAVDVERKKKINPAPQADEADDQADRLIHHECIREGEAPREYIEKFRASVSQHKAEITKEGSLIPKDKPIADILPETKDHRQHTHLTIDKKVLENLFPFGDEELKTDNGQITLESIEKNKRVLLNRLKSKLPEEDVKKLNCFSMVDVDIDSPSYVNEKVVNVGFNPKECYVEKISKWDSVKEFRPYYHEGRSHGKEFDFDHQPILEGHPGPSPSVILQALTMSNANDGINLERLETIGDSFLKFAITAYLYCAHPTVHEGKLSHMRSKQVSNLNLYRLGRARRLGARMTASKFEPHDNWLPPCHRPPHTQHAKDHNQEPNPAPTDGPVDGSGCFIPYNLITQHSIPDKSIADCVEALIGAYLLECGPRGALLFMSWLGIRVLPRHELPLPNNHPYVIAEESRVEKKPAPQPPKPPLLTTDSESSCSDEDSPWQQQEELPPGDDWSWPGRPVGSLRPYKNEDGEWVQAIFGELRAPPSPLLRYIADPEGELDRMLSGYDALENTLQYRFRDRSLLLQALTHASHQTNRLTDCYQRLEFLGDAVLDYLITRHLYEDARRHSPGALTDLRSALVNNTIFATLAARHGFHKYFRHMSPGLDEVLTKYVKIQEENGHSISEEHYLIQEDEMEQAEDVEVPKALGDLFESVAGAIFLDSGMCVGAVWKSYVRLMGAELEAFSAAAPKSPVRELLEAEPDTAKFGKPERLADGRRVRVCVEVFGRGAFKGVGRNYRIAKGTAARCALRHLRIHRAR